MDAGAWFNRAHPDLAKDEFTREHVPTLEKIFELVANRNCVIYVEIKTDDEPLVDDLVQSVIDLVRRYDFEDRVVIVSFNLGGDCESEASESFDSNGRTVCPETWRRYRCARSENRCNGN